MADDFYPFVDSGDPAPDNTHLLTTDSAFDTGSAETPAGDAGVRYATRIAIYDDMLSTPRIIVISPHDIRSYLEEITNTVYRCMKEQGGRISLMVIREIVENFIHAHFVEPIISVLDGGNTIRFADQGPGIQDKERAFEFGVTSARREQKRYIRGTGAGFPMVQQYLENAGGAVSIEDNLGQGTVVTVTVDAGRAREVEAAARRGAAVRGARGAGEAAAAGAMPAGASMSPAAPQQAPWPGAGAVPPSGYPMPPNAAWVPQQMQQAQQMAQGAPYPVAPPPATGWPYGSGTAYPMAQPTPWPAIAIEDAPSRGGAVSGGPTAGPRITERGLRALAFLAERGTCGPTDLAAAFGASNATWSRELEALTLAGLATKVGQKRVLTEMGRLWIQQHAPQQ